MRVIIVKKTFYFFLQFVNKQTKIFIVYIVYYIISFNKHAIKKLQRI